MTIKRSISIGAFGIEETCEGLLLKYALSIFCVNGAHIPYNWKKINLTKRKQQQATTQKYLKMKLRDCDLKNNPSLKKNQLRL